MALADDAPAGTPPGCRAIIIVSEGKSSRGSPQLWFEGEFLLWGIRDSSTPPLAAIGTAASRGVLGRPGTVVLFGGDIDNELRSGARFTAGGAFDCLDGWGGELSGFFLADRSIGFAAGSNGDPILTRPFANAVTGREAAEQVANPALPGVLPLTGRVTASLSSRLWGLDPSLVKRTSLAGCGLSLDLLAGFRFLELEEGLTVTEDLLVPASSPQFAGTRFHLRDSFETGNDYYGGQVGARMRWDRGPLALEAQGKIALGWTHQTAAVGGATVITTPGQLPAAFAGGLLAQQTNIGEYARGCFAVVPEIGLRTGWQVTAHLRALAGYTFLYISNVARPGDQIDRVVNPTQLPPGMLVGPARPAFQFHGTGFWAHGVSLGLEYIY